MHFMERHSAECGNLKTYDAKNTKLAFDPKHKASALSPAYRKLIKGMETQIFCFSDFDPTLQCLLQRVSLFGL